MAQGIDELLAGGETLTVEFKRAQLSDDELVEAVACLANGAGGALLIGVEDDATVTGVGGRFRRPIHAARLGAFVQNRLEPAHSVDVRVEVVESVEVVVVEVPRADPGPVATKKGVYVRRGLDSTGRPACVPMRPHEVVSTGLASRGIDYAATQARGATQDDLDPAEFDRFRRLCATAGEASLAKLSEWDICSALGLVTPSGGLTLGSVLLFGSETAIRRWVPTVEFLFQDFREGTHLNERSVAPLLRAAEDLGRLLDARNSTAEFTIGLLRVDVPLLPTLTRREALANALVHRDYAELGPTAVRLTDSRFTVTNPGGFPPGVTVDNILGQSRPRSPALADAFKRAGLVDRKGKGVNEMFEAQLRAGRDAPDYSSSTSVSVEVSVPLSGADLDLVRFLVTFENDRQKPLTLDELRVLHDIRAMGSASNGELVETLDLRPADARATTARLLEAGVVEARGSGRNRRFHLTARFFDLAQDRNAYLRVKALDPLQQQQMVVEYVQSYGSITRSQAASLCQTTPEEARRLLKGLTDRGLLVLVGARRGARYELPETATP